MPANGAELLQSSGQSPRIWCNYLPIFQHKSVLVAGLSNFPQPVYSHDLFRAPQYDDARQLRAVSRVMRMTFSLWRGLCALTLHTPGALRLSALRADTPSPFFDVAPTRPHKKGRRIREENSRPAYRVFAEGK